MLLANKLGFGLARRGLGQPLALSTTSFTALRFSAGHLQHLRAFSSVPGQIADMSKLRNVAIIAHVDHGKTTLVDEILKQSGAAGDWKSGARHMDSNEIDHYLGI